MQAGFAHPLAQASDPSPVKELDLLLTWLHEAAGEYRVAVHAWVLLNDRITLLATPRAADSLPKLVQAIGRRFATRLKHGRVFSGRYRSALVEPGRWVLPAQIWLESLPVQLRYVEQAESWPWSSAAYHTGSSLAHSAWASDHQDYWQNGNTPFDRQANYRQRLLQGLNLVDSTKIEKALFGQWALGEDVFLNRLETLASRRLTPAARGRPKKTSTTSL
ncbi:MAG TPA: hypothetical protein VIP51_08270 [Eoetvoesiella sp.]